MKPSVTLSNCTADTAVISGKASRSPEVQLYCLTMPIRQMSYCCVDAMRSGSEELCVSGQDQVEWQFDDGDMCWTWTA